MLPEPLPDFLPARTPGVQERWLSSEPSPTELFKRLFDERSVNIICDNTNKHAQRNIHQGKKYTWRDISSTDFYKFVGLLLYMAMLKLPQVSQYWRQDSFFTVLAPALVMSRNTFQAISWNLHMSDPHDDVENDKKKGTAEYDPLQRLRPLYDHLRNTLKIFYHPRQNIAIDEQTVSAKSKYGMYRCIRNKYDIKLFVLTDCSNGYTSDLSVHVGRYQKASEHGPAYDTVIGMMNQNDLGTGYHLYCDSFFTSPQLFTELLSFEVHACGKYRENRRETVIGKKDSRGTIRWTRDGPLLFVKWMDSKPVTMCSTIHTVYSGGMAKRNVKDKEGQWKVKQIPMPTPVAEYNKYRAGVDLSDRLAQDYSVHCRSVDWYKLIFQRFIDIVATNSYIIHKELSQMKGNQPMTQLKFMETLSAELCGQTLDMTPVPPPRETTCDLLPLCSDSGQSSLLPPAMFSLPTCTPVAIKPDVDTSKKATEGRRSCVRCKRKTAWKCRRCDVSLCVILDRNCFADWHDGVADIQKGAWYEPVTV